MLKWLRLRSRRAETRLAPDSREQDRDSGEEERASEEEVAREVAPSGLTRVKTENI